MMINTTLCYIERDGCYLLLHRTKKEHDFNKDKWIGVGGKFEEGESPEECLLREVKEETGLDLVSWRYCGIVTFIADDYPAEYMHLYLSDEFTGSGDRNLNYSHLTWDDILDMHLSGYWEIQNHSYDCHTYDARNGVSQVSNESDEDYRTFLTSDICRLQDKIAYVTGVSPTTFTYPFGAFNENTDTILKEIGFKATLSCTEGVSTIKKGDPGCLYKLKRHLRPPGSSPQEFFTFLN